MKSLVESLKEGFENINEMRTPKLKRELNKFAKFLDKNVYLADDDYDVIRLCRQDSTEDDDYGYPTQPSIDFDVVEDFGFWPYCNDYNGTEFNCIDSKGNEVNINVKDYDFDIFGAGAKALFRYSKQNAEIFSEIMNSL